LLAALDELAALRGELLAASAASRLVNRGRSSVCATLAWWFSRAALDARLRVMATLTRAEIHKLDVATRLALIEELWDSLAEDPATTVQLPLTDAERAMLDERLREHGEDPSATRPWVDVRADLRKQR
jgi:putative addiction module component (TIGR02574 family)